MAGYQSKGFEDGGVSSCMKHFFANNAETLRNSNHSIMTERTAREMYLRPFEYAFSVNKPDSMMTGYNAVNGYYCSDSDELLRGVLREDMGYNGYVMTDWGGYGDKGLEGMLSAGISFTAPGSPESDYTKPIENALNNGALSRAVVVDNLCAMIATLI